MTIRVVLADDHRIILEGLEQLFRRESDFEVVATCTDGDQALAAVARYSPDVLVLDVKMPGRDGLSVLKRIHEENRATRVVLLTAFMTDDEVVEAMQHGVRGLVLKESAAVRVVDTVRKVAAGQRALDQNVIARTLEEFVTRQHAVQRVSEVLSPRETEIVRMVATGMRNKEIATRLSIGEGTVKTHLHTIYRKLGVHGRVELALYASERGLA